MLLPDTHNDGLLRFNLSLACAYSPPRNSPVGLLTSNSRVRDRSCSSSKLDVRESVASNIFPGCELKVNVAGIFSYTDDACFSGRESVSLSLSLCAMINRGAGLPLPASAPTDTFLWATTPSNGAVMRRYCLISEECAAPAFDAS